jgi:hypothetical protein
MTDSVAISLITNSATVLLGLVTSYFAYRGLQQGKSNNMQNAQVAKAVGADDPDTPTISQKADALLVQGNGHTTMLTEALEKSHVDAAALAAKTSDGQAALIDKLMK